MRRVVELEGNRIRNRGLTNLIANPAGASLKRIAWAYGVAKKGSDEETKLHELLVARAREVQP